MKVTRYKEVLIFIAIGLLATVLRLYNLGYYSLWMDEVFQVSLQSRAGNIIDVVKYASLQNQPPLDYIIGWILSKYIPFSEFSVRFPSFLFGTGTVLVSFLFVRKLFNFWTALISGLLLTFSPTLIHFSQEARPYSIFLFFLMVMLALFFKIIESGEGKIGPWIVFFLVASLTLLTRGMVPVTALVALNAAFGAVMLDFFVEEKKFVSPFTPSIYRNLILATMLAGLTYLPFFINIWEQSHHLVNENPVSGSIAWPVFEPLQLILTSRLPDKLGNYSLFCLVGFIFGAYFIFRQRREKPTRFLFLLFGVLEPLVSVYLYYIVVDTTVLKPKSNYFLQSIIPVFIISSYGYFAFFKSLSERVGLKRQGVLYSLPVFIVFFLSIPELPAYYNKPKADYRGAVEYLQTIYSEDDVAVFDTFRKYGAWEPHLYGKGVYYSTISKGVQYGSQMEIRQFKWSKWVDLLEEGFKTDGRLFLFLEGGKAGGPPFTSNEALIERNFHHITIIYAKDTSLSLKETSLLYIEEMLNFFPDNSSKVDLYLAKARLLCQDAPVEARKSLALAEDLLKGKPLQYQCK